jgi:hypothetical protein
MQWLRSTTPRSIAAEKLRGEEAMRDYLKKQNISITERAVKPLR